ncbi:restriction endonuclease [Corynebacterium camporealensis]
MVNYLRTDPIQSVEFDEVCRWTDWKYNNNRADAGIDLVARRREDGKWTAIQCKFYKDTTQIQKRHIDSFFEDSGRAFQTENGPEYFAHRLIIATTDRWSSNAEQALENQLIPTRACLLNSLVGGPILER